MMEAAEGSLGLGESVVGADCGGGRKPQRVYASPYCYSGDEGGGLYFRDDPIRCLYLF